MLPGEVKLTHLLPGEVILLVFWCYCGLVDWLIPSFHAGSMFCCLCDAGVPWSYESTYQYNAWQTMPKLSCLLSWTLNVTQVSKRQRWATHSLQLPIETLVNEYDTLSLQFYINITKFKVRNIAHRHPDLAILEVATLTWTLRPKLQALREQSSTASPSGKNRL